MKPKVSLSLFAGMVLVVVGCEDSADQNLPTTVIQETGQAAQVTRPPKTFAQQVAWVQQNESDTIWIEKEAIGQSEIAQLAKLEGLATLKLDAGVVDDKAIAQLATSLDRLVHLRLRLSPIGNAGLASLAKMKSLEILNLPHGEFTADGIRHLVGLKNLHQLRLGSSKATNEVCDAIAEISQLRAVHLINIPVSDEGLLKLASIGSLESLYLDGTKVTDAGADTLFERYPDLHVHFNQTHHDRDPASHEH